MGIPTLIKTLTASNSASLEFVDGTADVTLDSTYDEYMFVFTDINVATDGADFVFQVNATDDAGGGYDTSPITSTDFYSQHAEDASFAGLAYDTAKDQAQGTNFEKLVSDCGNGSDESAAGIMHLFSPASTTYVKHFYLVSQTNRLDDRSIQRHHAGYINDTTAIDEIQFKASSGNFDGVIQMYGIA
jgi:hypothetical protein